MASGIVVIDNSALKQLEPTNLHEKIRRDARIADWEVGISVINAVEAAKTTSPIGI